MSEIDSSLLRDFVRWDVRTWSAALAHWEKSTDWKKVENCLELGGNEGGLSLWLALKNKQVVCSDLQGVNERAEMLHQQHNVSSRIRYQSIDATEIPYENYFDVIVFKSVIGGVGRGNAIEKQQRVFQEIHKALRPGGRLLFAENLVGSRLHRKLRSGFVGWGDSWRYVSLSEMNNFLSIFSSKEIFTNGFLATLGRNESQRNWLAKMDEHFFNRVLPAEYKYMCYGYAVK